MARKSGKLQWQFGSGEYAQERSQQDAQTSNENARAAAQAAILINGGAATAVLAFLSKDKLDPFILRNVPICLLGYAVGVFAGAFMTFCMGRALRLWSVAWRVYMIDPKDVAGVEKADGEAREWNDWAHYAFYTAMACFVIGSVVLAVLLLFSKPIPSSAKETSITHPAAESLYADVACSSRQLIGRKARSGALPHHSIPRSTSA
jgi:hypothetical protein